MRMLVAALVAATLPISMAAAQQPDVCEVPGYLLFGENELNHVAAAVKAQKRLNIVVIGTRSSTLAGPDGAQHAYPARLQAALKQSLPKVTVKVAVHATPRQTAEQMAEGLKKILPEEKPDLVIWQAGTIDSLRGVEPDEFGNFLNDGVERIQATGADVILMNMQYSPRTETMISVTPYAENMRWVAQQRGVPLFDRFAIMRHWSDTGVFDFYAATRNFTVAQQVHDCLGRALAVQIIDAAQLGPMSPKPVQ
jgi:lysophospholipase L1-like esterase